MYVTPTSLPHLLAPRDYFTAEGHARDLSILRRSWHLVGTVDQLARDGDFITTEVVGVAVHIRNFSGQLRALSNVCAHRHALLTSLPAGNSPKMRCQYHGWEYQADGRTGRIPEPKNFVPFDRATLCLPVYHIATIGQLVFVNVTHSPNPPSISDFFGADFYEFLQARFGVSWLPSLAWQPEYSANWKVPIENSLEAYHVPAVHPNTFKVDPGEEKSEHHLLAHRTAFHARLPFSPHSRLDALFQRLEGRVVRWLGHNDTRSYAQHHVFPNLLFSFTDAMSLCQCITPTSLRTARAVVRQFGRLPVGNNWPRRALARVWARVTASVNKHILKEDLHIFSSIQRGLELSPHAGILGRCEERLYAFQNFLLQQPISDPLSDVHNRSNCLPVSQCSTVTAISTQHSSEPHSCHSPSAGTQDRPEESQAQ